MVAGKKKALVATKANAVSASALKRPSGVSVEDRTSRDSLQLDVSKRKPEELSQPAAALRPGICSMMDPRPRAPWAK